MVYTATQQLKIFGDRHYLDHLHYSPYLWGRLSGSYGINPLRKETPPIPPLRHLPPNYMMDLTKEHLLWNDLGIHQRVIPADYPMPTLFVGAPSNGYTDDLVEQDWQDVQDFLFPHWWTEPEGYITEAAPDAISLIKTHVQEKWKLEPHIRIVFCGVVSDTGNVWEFADGSVVPFSQFANAVEGRATPVVLDVISATPNAGDWAEKIKAFNAKNAPSKIINLYVPDASGGVDHAGSVSSVAASAKSVSAAAESEAPAEAAAKAPAAAEEEVATPVIAASLKSVASAAVEAAVEEVEEAAPSTAAEDAAAAAAAADKLAAKTEAAAESAAVVAAGAEAAKVKLANDVLVEKAKMNVLWSGVRTRLKQRGEDKQIRAEKYELLRKNKHWYDWPYYKYPDWQSLPYHPQYNNYYYPWNVRPGLFKELAPFADIPGWVTQ